MSHQELDHTLEGRVARLRPVTHDDLAYLYEISTCPENGFRWRYRGTFPDPARYAQEHANGTLLQLVVETRASGERAGIVNLYGENLRDGWAYVGAVAAPEFQSTGVVVDGAAVLVSYAFNCWAFRKLYLETIEYNLEVFAAGLREVAVEEARLRDHVFFGGRYWDVVTHAIYRDRWDRTSARSPSRSPHSGVMSYESFVDLLVKEFGIDATGRDVLVVEDLGFDSILIAEMIVVLCDAGNLADPDELPDLGTLGDVYDWYAQMLG